MTMQFTVTLKKTQSHYLKYESLKKIHKQKLLTRHSLTIFCKEVIPLPIVDTSWSDLDKDRVDITMRIPIHNSGKGCLKGIKETWRCEYDFFHWCSSDANYLPSVNKTSMEFHIQSAHTVSVYPVSLTNCWEYLLSQNQFSLIFWSIFKAIKNTFLSEITKSYLQIITPRISILFSQRPIFSACT